MIDWLYLVPSMAVAGYLSWSVLLSVFFDRDSEKDYLGVSQHEPGYHGPLSYDFHNAPCDEAGVVRVQGRDIPWTITTPDYGDSERCYSVSPYGHYIGYAYDEIRLHAKGNVIKEKIANFLVGTLGLVVRMLHLDDCLYFNNWLLSTNLWPNDIKWHRSQIQDTNASLMQILAGRPKAIVWRSVDPLSQPLLCQALESCFPDCLMVPARVANWIDYSDKEKLLKTKKNLRWDVKLFQKKVGWDVLEQKQVSNDSIYILKFVAPDEITLDMAQHLIGMYNNLYLSKYSRRNPQFTPEALVRMVKNGFLTLITIRLRAEPDEIIVFAVRKLLDGVITYPMVGYDMANKDRDLYRLCSILFINESIRTNNPNTHLSAGSNAFKRHRGAVSTVEYNAVFVNHLPFYQRWGWKTLQAVLNKIITVDRAH